MTQSSLTIITRVVAVAANCSTRWRLQCLTPSQSWLTARGTCRHTPPQLCVRASVDKTADERHLGKQLRSLGHAVRELVVTKLGFDTENTGVLVRVTLVYKQKAVIAEAALYPPAANAPCGYIIPHRGSVNRCVGI